MVLAEVGPAFVFGPPDPSRERCDPLATELAGRNLGAAFLAMDPVSQSDVTRFFETFGGPPEGDDSLNRRRHSLPTGDPARREGRWLDGPPWITFARLRQLHDGLRDAATRDVLTNMDEWWLGRRIDPDARAAPPMGTVSTAAGVPTLIADLWQLVLLSTADHLRSGRAARCVAPLSGVPGGVCGEVFVRRRASERYHSEQCRSRATSQRHHTAMRQAWEDAGRPGGTLKAWRTARRDESRI
jgi:hypothetical protein